MKTYYSPTPQSRYFLILTLSMITCLLLLINTSFKIVEWHGYLFSTNSLLCPIIAGLYLLALKKCTFYEQKHILNCSLMALYAFSIGVYLLVNLPPADYMHNNPAYPIVFEDIPRKFFAAAIAFFLSIYFPHWLYGLKTRTAFTPLKTLLLALFGGILFFSINFYLLFMNLTIVAHLHLWITSSIICLAILSLIGGSMYSLQIAHNEVIPEKNSHFPIYQYMICIAVVVMLICLVCEYRLVAFTEDWPIAASGLLFPIVVMISTLIGELYGCRANLHLTFVLIVTQLLFDLLLMSLVILPSPAFFNINSFYIFILPRKLPAASLALLVTFVSNSLLLEYLRRSPLAMQRSTRVVIANICATSLLCMVNYGLLFGGMYDYEQVLYLTLNAWVWKIAMVLISLPVVLEIYNRINEKLALEKCRCSGSSSS